MQDTAKTMRISVLLKMKIAIENMTLYSSVTFPSIKIKIYSIKARSNGHNS